jgi:hypothetical protein
VTSSIGRGPHAQADLHRPDHLLLLEDAAAHDGLVGAQVLEDGQTDGVHGHGVVADDHDIAPLLLTGGRPAIGEGGDAVQHDQVRSVAQVQLGDHPAHVRGLVHGPTDAARA